MDAVQSGSFHHILIVILLFFGSKSIPGIAKTMGQAMYQIRNASNELQQEIKKSGVGIKEELNINSILKKKDGEEEILLIIISF